MSNETPRSEQDTGSEPSVPADVPAPPFDFTAWRLRRLVRFAVGWTIALNLLLTALACTKLRYFLPSVLLPFGSFTTLVWIWQPQWLAVWGVFGSGSFPGRWMKTSAVGVVLLAAVSGAFKFPGNSVSLGGFEFPAARDWFWGVVSLSLFVPMTLLAIQAPLWLLRWLGLRLIGLRDGDDRTLDAPRQFTLRRLLLFTALLAGMLGLAQFGWELRDLHPRPTFPCFFLLPWRIINRFVAPPGDVAHMVLEFFVWHFATMTLVTIPCLCFVLGRKRTSAGCGTLVVFCTSACLMLSLLGSSLSVVDYVASLVWSILPWMVCLYGGCALLHCHGVRLARQRWRPRTQPPSTTPVAAEERDDPFSQLENHSHGPAED